MTKQRVNHLSAEKEFLFSAVRWAVSGGFQPVASDNIDWAIVADEAVYHGVLPQLHRCLEDTGLFDILPHEVSNTIRMSFEHNRKRNLGLAGDLWLVLKRLEAEGITAISFKGPSLAMLAYGNLAWREFVDVDILVAERDLAKVATVLQSAGYEPHRDPSVLSDPVFVSIEREFYFTSSRRGTMIDIQWRLSSSVLPFDVDIEDMLSNRILVHPGGKEIPTARLEDSLLLICVHGSRHHWSSLKWLTDVAGLINLNPQIDWELVLRQARALNCQRVLSHSLLLACDLMGAQLPPTLDNFARRDRASREIAGSICETLAQPLLVPMTKFDVHRYFWKLQNGPVDRFRHFFRVVFTPNVADWEFRRLPTSLKFLYWFMRPLRLIGQPWSC